VVSPNLLKDARAFRPGRNPALRAVGQEKKADRTARLSRAFDHTCDTVTVRTAYRDVNAAKNILAAGRAVARGSPGDACGAEVSHSGSSRVRSAANQEPRPARAGILVLQGGE